MANIIIKSDEKKAGTNAILNSYGIRNPTREQREMAECISATSKETVERLKRMEARR